MSMPWKHMVVGGSRCVTPLFLTSPLDGGEWSNSRFGCFACWEEHSTPTPCILWIHVCFWVGFIGALDLLGKRKTFDPCLDSDLFSSALGVVTLPTTLYRRHARTHTHAQKVTHRIMTFRSTTERIHDGGPHNIIIRSTVLQLPSLFSTVMCCTGL